MINLNAYDVLEHNIKYWIWVSRKILYIKGIKPKNYYSFFCRFDKENNSYDYFILFTDNCFRSDIVLHKLVKTTKDTYKASISGIFDKLNIQFKDDKHLINLIIEDKTEDEEIYRIDFNP